jgi:drug/metabolite transporter (DMT)-like permease
MTAPAPSAHSRAVGLLVLTALGWSIGGVLIKVLPWHPLAVAGMRGLIAGLVLLALHRSLSLRGSRVRLYGALAYAVCTASVCIATKLTTAANAILLQYTAPIWVALLGAWLLGERTTRADWITIGVVLAGMGLFFAGGLDLANVLGNAVAILSGLAFAAVTITLRHQKDGSPVESVILGNFLAFLICLPWIIDAPPLPAVGWAAMLTLGVVQLGLSYWLYVRAIRHVSALEAVLIPVIEPILNPVWVLLAIGERPTPQALLGGVIVLSAVTSRAVHAIRDGRRPAAAGA